MSSHVVPSQEGADENPIDIYWAYLGSGLRSAARPFIKIRQGSDVVVVSPETANRLAWAILDTAMAIDTVMDFTRKRDAI